MIACSGSTHVRAGPVVWLHLQCRLGIARNSRLSVQSDRPHDGRNKDCQCTFCQLCQNPVAMQIVEQHVNVRCATGSLPSAMQTVRSAAGPLQ